MRVDLFAPNGVLVASDWVCDEQAAWDWFHEMSGGERGCECIVENDDGEVLHDWKM